MVKWNKFFHLVILLSVISTPLFGGGFKITRMVSQVSGKCAMFVHELARLVLPKHEIPIETLMRADPEVNGFIRRLQATGPASLEEMEEVERYQIYNSISSSFSKLVAGYFLFLQESEALVDAIFSDPALSMARIDEVSATEIYINNRAAFAGINRFDRLALSYKIVERLLTKDSSDEIFRHPLILEYPQALIVHLKARISTDEYFLTEDYLFADSDFVLRLLDRLKQFVDGHD